MTKPIRNNNPKDAIRYRLNRSRQAFANQRKAPISIVTKTAIKENCTTRLWGYQPWASAICLPTSANNDWRSSCLLTPEEQHQQRDHQPESAVSFFLHLIEERGEKRRHDGTDQVRDRREPSHEVGVADAGAPPSHQIFERPDRRLIHRKPRPPRPALPNRRLPAPSRAG